MSSEQPNLAHYHNDGHTIYHADTLVTLPSLADHSVDLIFADPPYNIGKDFDGLKECWQADDFKAWFEQWLIQCKRVLKPGGTFYLMNATENMAWIDLLCQQHFLVKSRIVWTYDSSGVQAKSYFGSMYEPILMLINDPDNYTFNASDIMVEAKTGAQRKLMDYRKNPPQPYHKTKVPGNVWDFPRVRYKMDEYENHPTQKPEALLERIILASSNPEDLVLDPFAGSFTTAAVAKRLGRKSISIEINEEYLKIGLRRLGIESQYHPDEIKKIKKRKTNNLSKKDRQQQTKHSQNN